MSALCVINKLHEVGHKIIGCDIYPREWHFEASLCDIFRQAPFATSPNEYISFLVNLAKCNNVKYIIPLTDLEIDVINRHREVFENNGMVLCMPSTEVLSIVRDKYALYNFFLDDAFVPSIESHLNDIGISDIKIPCVAKPRCGRSSEGLMYIHSQNELKTLGGKQNYIIQDFKPGSIFTVDYVRNNKSNRDFLVGREELLRTKNGAGLTVRIVNDESLYELVSYIDNKLCINGCVNMEFIKSDNKYFLIDINPRFSAGVAFSLLAGYDMVNNHLNCFSGKDIMPGVAFKTTIMVKKYVEHIIK